MLGLLVCGIQFGKMRMEASFKELVPGLTMKNPFVKRIETGQAVWAKIRAWNRMHTKRKSHPLRHSVAG